ncbi:expressed unknown protein [Seminavis robusta]|uniref:MYND-type domain-containing protein n=1 Tax=Seminavis robusta TaxID=568900 RepID=A0A9N8DSI6_9STRA|nr:expressed unknown protein [Seminavis robusta]|eukprot:Sro339_g121080.1 n/a (867) ;mRNA; f:47757-50426
MKKKKKAKNGRLSSRVGPRDSIQLPASFASLQLLAQEHNLYVLQKFLNDTAALVQSSKKEGKLESLSRMLESACNDERYKPRANSTAATQHSLNSFCSDLSQAFALYDRCNSSYTDSILHDKDKLQHATSLLASRGIFDMGLQVFRVQHNFLERVAQENNHKTEADIRKLEKQKPLDNEHRKMEVGFEKAKKLAASLVDAEQANELGKQAWRDKFMWRAELFWERATQLSPNSSQAKYWSNLAFVRIHIGRYLRSLVIGYRVLAQNMIEAALLAAEQSVQIDPMWERGYQRAAEAHLALGPYDHALDAYRILQKAMNTIDHPGAALKNLHKTTKERARLWFSLLKVAPNQSTIPRLLESALTDLRIAVAQSLGNHGNGNMQRAGDRVVEQVALVHAVLQLIYLRRSQWARESVGSNIDVIQVQFELVQMAKIVPLDVVVASERLKQLVFVEDPFSFWGLDQLDRLGVDSIKPHENDPLVENDHESERFTESMKRHNDSNTLSLSNVQSCNDMVNGKVALSEERDFATHHRCAFSLTVLHRVLLTRQCFLFDAAIDKVMEFALRHSDNILFAGGEFLGYAIHAALGIGKFDIPDDENRTEYILGISGGVALAAREINQSQDVSFSIQRALSRLKPSDWTRQSVVDIQDLLRFYLLPALEGIKFEMDDNQEDYISFAVGIMASLLDGHPDVLHYFGTGKAGEIEVENEAFCSVLRLFPYGVFLVRQYMHTGPTLLDKGVKATTKNIVKRITDKWHKLPHERRSAYRWETLSDATKTNLASMAPIPKVDIMMAQREGQNLREENEMTVTKLTECRVCGKGFGLGVELFPCQCQAVRYCGTTCQRQDWPKHRKICKKFCKDQPAKNCRGK